MQTKRIQKWDILKFILIFLVVLGHICDFHTERSETARSLYVFIYTFHMPVFIFLSGLFSKRTIAEKRLDKIFSYLILYLFIKIIHWLYFALLHQNYSFSLFSENGVAWFMFALFAFSLITMLTRHVSPRYVLIVWILLACFAGYDPSVNKVFVLSRIIVFYPFYYLGYILDTDDVLEFTRSQGLKRIICILYILILGISIFYLGDSVYFIRPLLTGCNPFASLGDLMPLGFILRLLCYILQFVTGYVIITLAPEKLKTEKFSQLGQYTLSVYVFHYLILYILYYSLHIQDWYARIFPSSPTALIIPIAVGITLLLSNKKLTEFLNWISRIPLQKQKF